MEVLVLLRNTFGTAVTAAVGDGQIELELDSVLGARCRCRPLSMRARITTSLSSAVDDGVRGRTNPTILEVHAENFRLLVLSVIVPPLLKTARLVIPRERWNARKIGGRLPKIPVALMLEAGFEGVIM